MHVLIHNNQMKSALTEAIKSCGTDEVARSDSSVLLEAEFQGTNLLNGVTDNTPQFTITALKLGEYQSTVRVPEPDIISPGSCLLYHPHVVKKIKYMGSEQLELNLLDEETFQVSTEEIEGTLAVSLDGLVDFPKTDGPLDPICTVNADVFIPWIKSLAGFCSNTGTVSIILRDGFLYGCGFEPSSHQTLMLFSRIAVEDASEDYDISIKSANLHSLPVGMSNLDEINICVDTDEISDRFGIRCSAFSWWTRDCLTSSLEFYEIGESCSEQPAICSFQVNAANLISKIQYLNNQPHLGAIGKGLNLSLDVFPKTGEIALKLQPNGSDKDVTLVQISDLQGNWVDQSYDPDKLLSMVSCFQRSETIEISQFLLEEDGDETSAEDLGLKATSTSEQSRMQTFLESLI